MSTQTLKAPPKGAGEQQWPAAELPEKLYPARTTLATKLDQIERAMADLAGFTAQVERATVAENSAMDDEGLSETEAMEAIGTARLQQDVLKARIANRQKAVIAYSKELALAVTGGVNELRGLVNAEAERREGIISERLVAVLQVGNAINPVHMTRELAQLLAFSGPVQAVKALAPPSYVEQGNTENLVSAAKEILNKYEAIIAEAGKIL